MAKVYTSWLNHSGDTSAEVIATNGIVLREMPGNDHAVAFAYVATPEDSIMGTIYAVRFCAKRRTGSYEWLSFRDRAPGFATMHAAQTYADSQPL